MRAHGDGICPDSSKQAWEGVGILSEEQLEVRRF